MRLSVCHSTRLSFDASQRTVLQSLRLIPADFKGQTVLDWTVEVEDATHGSRFRDGAGDITETARLEGPVDELSLTVSGIVETTDTTGVLGGLREKITPFFYLQGSRLTRPDKAVLELGRETLASHAKDQPLDKAHALSLAVKEALAEALEEAEPETPSETEEDDAAEKPDTPVTATSALATGSSDAVAHTHLLISLAIASDIPARFVHGYALAEMPDEDRPALQLAPEDLHSWAELHIDRLGWVGFDALNGCCPDDRYIRLCSGVDALDAAPIRTVATGAPGSDTEIAVAAAVVGQVQQ